MFFLYDLPMRKFDWLKHDVFAVKEGLFHSMSKVSNCETKGTLLKESLYIKRNAKSNGFWEKVFPSGSFINIDSRVGGVDFPILPKTFHFSWKCLCFASDVSVLRQMSLFCARCLCFARDVFVLREMSLFCVRRLCLASDLFVFRQISLFGARCLCFVSDIFVWRQISLFCGRFLCLAPDLFVFREISLFCIGFPISVKNVPFPCGHYE